MMNGHMVLLLLLEELYCLSCSLYVDLHRSLLARHDPSRVVIVSIYYRVLGREVSGAAAPTHATQTSHLFCFRPDTSVSH